jgi:hypothetical protein
VKWKNTKAYCVKSFSGLECCACWLNTVQQTSVQPPVSQSDGYFKCLCKNCGGRIEFPGEGAGRTVPCPHCNWPTVLATDVPSATVPIGGGAAARKRIFRFFFIAAVVVAAAGAGVYWYLSHRGPAPAPSAATQPAQGNNTLSKTSAPVVVAPVVPPDPWHGLMAGPITLDKSGDGRLVYAVGTLRNESDHQRFGVKVELDVFDAGNEKVGTATDYTSTIDPGKEWKFRALVTDRTAASAKLTAVKED